MPQSPLSPVGGPVSLEKLAYDAIKSAILGFKLKPGDALVESDLAQQLGISKTPVRDALLRLEKEGLVVKIPYKGSYVSEITKQTVIELFQIRAVMEGLAAGLAAPFLTDADIHACEEFISRHLQALQAGDIEAAAVYNRKFHQTILQRCPNQRLLQILSNLDDHIQRFRLLSNYQRGKVLKSVQEHEAILDAVRRKSASEVENAMKAHLSNVLHDLSNQDFDQLIEYVSQQAQFDSVLHIEE
jgi:DNA-binding GntR family transcriptional regulator